MPDHSAAFPLDPWCITESAADAASNFLHETLFALGNGYVGLRGNHEDGYSGPAGTSLDGSYLNGFYESEPIVYPEAAFGLAKTNQFMLNVPNAKGIALSLGDECFDVLSANLAGSLSNYQRSLDFRSGLLVRSLEWTAPSGRQVAIRSRRLVCFVHKHVFAIEYEVTPLNFSGPIRLFATLDGAVSNQQAGDDPRVGSAVSGPALQWIGMQQDDSFLAITQRTHNSGFTLVSAIESSIGENTPSSRVSECDGEQVGQRFDVTAQLGKPVRLIKFGAYFSSRDYPADTLMTRARQALTQAREAGFDALCTEQHAYLADFWATADVEIAGDAALQQGIRFNQFHLLQSVGRDGKTNIAAKGVTGEGYEGHYFWDTEIYIFPFFLYSKPDIARKLLEYRYAGLDKARERARQMSHAQGALYPWRTIAGDECSAYFPAGTAQYHINADIAYSIKLYYEATGDLDYMADAGAEIVLETARIWIAIGNLDREGRFCINEVTGPDEYTALVNNNYYTNAMAQMHLGFAADISATLARERPAQWARLSAAIGLGAGEIDAWRQACACMALPYDAALGIHAQDDSFLSKKVWDFAATPKQHYPLLLNYHPLVIYRHQVCKQADVVLALLLLPEQFTQDAKRRDFDYYEAVTTHDSSLSPCIFSIIASEVGYHDKAYDYFMQTARLDLDNTHGNTHYGVHTAAMAGTWMGVAYGFAGMRVSAGALRFAPTLPARWSHYQFKIHLRGALLQVRVEAAQVEYTLLEGDSIDFSHAGAPVSLNQAAPRTCLACKEPA
ncbi:MAG: glycoside hydrolase family 65 protein [Massilia sp.]|nr:glycoside hydrolase family 65 protein [Massilia sp.]